MKEIIYDDDVIARYISGDEVKKGLSFYSENDDFLQVGVWKYDKGKVLQKHVHNLFERNINRTNEVLYVKKGSLKVEIYSFSEIFVESMVLEKKDMLILLNCGHGYEILEDDTQVLEIKNGPYFGPEIDRRRF